MYNFFIKLSICLINFFEVLGVKSLIDFSNILWVITKFSSISMLESSSSKCANIVLRWMDLICWESTINYQIGNLNKLINTITIYYTVPLLQSILLYIYITPKHQLDHKDGHLLNHSTLHTCFYSLVMKYELLHLELLVILKPATQNIYSNKT